MRSCKVFGSKGEVNEMMILMMIMIKNVYTVEIRDDGELLQVIGLYLERF